MKKLLMLPLLAMGLFFTACNDTDGGTEQGDAELIRLTEENRALREAQAERDSLDNDYHQTMMEIENNLAEIYKKEGEIAEKSLTGAELSGDAKDRITAEINAINELMAENRKKIASLTKKLKNSRSDVKSLEARLNDMDRRLSEKDTEIMGLRDELASLNIEMELLYLENEDLIRAMNVQTDEMNTVWYAMGTKKELIDNGVISKEGGLLGIGSTAVVADDFNSEYFTRMDKTKDMEIMIGNKKAKLITTHPESSFEWVGEDPIEKLKITNQSEFWKASPYMVVMID